ncbi:alanine-zipper protein [Neisseria animaloris]|uniref:alanine-zipper protein n=1 Tax=Neisseria animaloris TaxID=326522 RepID=UPI0039E07526
MTNNNGNNEQIHELVKIYLCISSTVPEKHDELAQMSFEFHEKVFQHVFSSCDRSIILPYKDISDVVFQNDCLVSGDTLNNFCAKVDDVINTKLREDSRSENEIQRALDCHKKLVGHIQLAQAQKEFMQKSVKEARKIADEAKTVADDAKTVANEAKTVANEAKTVANEAKTVAGKADDTYKSMFANYVTILGVFTAIIVTIFGGLNVINVVMRQDGTNFSHVVSLSAISLMCVVLLLYLLANMIIKITQNSKNYYLDYLSWGIVLICVVAILLFGGMNKQPDNNESIQKNINQKKIQTTINSKQ